MPALQSAFSEAEYYVPPAETMRDAVARSAGGMFKLIHHRSQFKADMYLVSRYPVHSRRDAGGQIIHRI